MKYIKFSALVIAIFILLSFAGCNRDAAVPDNTTEQSDSDNTTRDAIRHGCYFLLFYKKGQDIM